MTCPTCGGLVDHYIGTVSTPVAAADLHRDGVGVVIERRTSIAGFLACSRCEWAETTAQVLSRYAAAEPCDRCGVLTPVEGLTDPGSDSPIPLALCRPCLQEVS